MIPSRVNLPAAETRRILGIEWCPRCEKDTMPNDTTDKCFFCELRLRDWDGAPRYQEGDGPRDIRKIPAAFEHGLEAYKRCDCRCPTCVQAASAERRAA